MPKIKVRERKNNNKNKVILDLCGGTGAWSKPYENAGYDVRIATLPDFDIRDWRNSWLSTLVFENKVYGIIAAPPCTQFSYARSRAKTPRDLGQGMEIVIACLNIIWQCIESAYENGNVSSFKFWALENPYKGYLIRFLGQPAMIFQPYEFGDEYTKATALWGWFNIPEKKQPTLRLTKEMIDKCKINNRPLPSISDFTGSKQAAWRSITPAGFAKAFFEANQ